MGTTPDAISVIPGDAVIGNDGLWSTFTISVGSPPQQVNVLPSTLVPVTWVVSTGGCTISSLPDCDDLRGGLFNKQQSTTWKDINTLSLGVESSLGWPQDDGGDFGFDAVVLNSPQGAVPIKNTVIASINMTDSYIGVLGLAARNVTLPNQNTTSLLGQLRNSSTIPSLSYSYTAGASYNNTKGTLTLGGFDASRSMSNGVSFDFATDSVEYLNVGLQSISFNGGGKTTDLLSAGLTANIDSTVSAFWLPNDTCNALANAYGLQFDSIHQLYTINSTQHDLNVKNNPQTSFQLGGAVAGGSTVSINFPYAAFDMNFTNPNDAAAHQLRIFPLRQATQSNQYTLGRAFLQEAVLTVDFERQNFSLAQAVDISGGTKSQIVNIISPTDKTGSTSPSSPAGPSSTAVTAVSSGSSFPNGAIAGIVIAVVAIIGGLIAFFLLRRRRQRRRAEPDTPGPELPNKPELAITESKAHSGNDYFSMHPTKGAPPTYTTTVSESEIRPGELESPRVNATTYNPHIQYTITSDGPSPYELEAGKDPAASELHSRSASITSSSLSPPTYPQASRASPTNSPLVELSHGSGDNRFSSPTAASGAEGAWNSSHIESPTSPASARSVPVSAVGPARMVSHGHPRSPRHHSPGGSFDNPGIGATIGSTGVPQYNALGFVPMDEIQRKNSKRSSRGSQSTLVGGLSGRASPEAGAAPGTNTITSPSAFSSPELMPIQHFPLDSSERVPGVALQGPTSEVQTPSDMGEILRRD